MPCQGGSCNISTDYCPITSDIGSDPEIHMILKIIVLFFILVFTFTWTLLYLNTHPARYHLKTTPKERKLAFSNISFTTNDHIQLKGWYLPTQNSPQAPTIIIAHGLGASKSDFIDLAETFINNNFNVLMFDFRAHGDSSGRATSLGLKEQQDITAAVDYIYTRTASTNKKIGLYGFSLGGAAGILTAARDTRIRAIVADTPFSSLKNISADIIKRTYHLPSGLFIPIANLFYRISFGDWMDRVSPLTAIKKISPRPVFLISSNIDAMTPVYHAERLLNAAAAPKKLWVIQGAYHGGTISSAGEEYTSKLIKYFNKYL